MIKLKREGKPAFLDDSKVKELTDRFKSTGDSVWNIEPIKSPLLASSNSKCAYCECSLSKESNYMEVEHFEDKCHNPEKVVVWENLLPSCKKCNGAKGTHNVSLEPIVNPYDDDPRDHLAIRLYRLIGTTSKGKTTIEVTDLNNYERLVVSRFQIGDKISELIITTMERLNAYSADSSVRNKNRLLSLVEGLLQECRPSRSYAASTSANLLNDPDFNFVINQLKRFEIWSEDLESLYQEASKLALQSLP